MAQLKWGKVGQLNFFDDHEYYQALGSLCRSEGYHITFETNSETESWGDAFRIKCLMQDSLLPDAFRIAKKNANRINCNDYVQHLYQHHHFTFDVANKVLYGNYAIVKLTVPESYHYDFDAGYNLKFTRHNLAPSNSQPGKQRIATKQMTRSLCNAASSGISYANIGTPINEIPPVGTPIVHKKFGFGKIIGLNTTNVNVVFDSGEQKIFSIAVVLSNNLLRKR